jgi:hypothetical protein
MSDQANQYIRKKNLKSIITIILFNMIEVS